MKTLKGFVGGTAFGFVCGGVFVTKKALESEFIQNSVKDAMVNKMTSVLYGKEMQVVDKCKPRKVTYQSYYTPYIFDSNDIVFETRLAADTALSKLNDMIKKFGVATVADMYDMADITPPHTADKYGWTNISGVTSERVRDGYILKMPKCKEVY